MHSTAATGTTCGSETGNVVRSVVANTRLNVKKFAYLAVARQLNADRFFQSPQQFLAIVGYQLIMTKALLKVKKKDYKERSFDKLQKAGVSLSTGSRRI